MSSSGAVLSGISVGELLLLLKESDGTLNENQAAAIKQLQNKESLNRPGPLLRLQWHKTPQSHCTSI